MEMVKRLVVSRRSGGVGWGGRGETPRTFRAVKYSIGYDGIMIGYIPLYICQNPWNVQRQE